MRCYAFVLASMYRYSWLIRPTFEISPEKKLDRGVGGVYRIKKKLVFLIFTRPLNQSHTTRVACHMECSSHIAILNCEF